MKEKLALLLSFVAILLLLLLLNSQTASAQSWNLTGNSNATANSKLGTTNAIPMRLMTNNQTRVYVDAKTGNVGINTGNISDPDFKLHVTGGNYGIYGTGFTYGVYGEGDYGIYGNGKTNGIYGIGGIYGVYGESANDFGLYGTSGYTGVYGDGGTFGVYGYSSTGNGVNGASGSKLGGNFYSVGSYGIRAGTRDGFYAGVFDGNVYAFGSYYSSSDKNLKQNIQDFGNAMGIINKLKPKNYEFRTDEKFASFNLPKGTHYGLIAQDVEQVLPNLVKETPQEVGRREEELITPDSNRGKAMTAGNEVKFKKGEPAKKELMNIKGVNYEELIPIIIKGMQEQDAKIEELTQLVKKLQGSSTVNSGVQGNSSIRLSSGSLDQNIPNPLTNSTSIGYALPEGTSKALLSIYDNNGNTVKQIPLNGSGKGAVSIEASTLSAGTYSYTLIIDGKAIETRRMVIAR
jgi:hypothetical protein